eukprot:7500254-Pyramimonas_sp.AAC.1
MSVCRRASKAGPQQRIAPRQAGSTRPILQPPNGHQVQDFRETVGAFHAWALLQKMLVGPSGRFCLLRQKRPQPILRLLGHP